MFSCGTGHLSPPFAVSKEAQWFHAFYYFLYFFETGCFVEEGKKKDKNIGEGRNQEGITSVSKLCDVTVYVLK